MATKDKKGGGTPAKGSAPVKSGGKGDKKKAGKQAGAKQRGPHAGAKIPAPAPRLKIHYQQKVRDRLMQQFSLTNPHQVPTLEKIVVNVGVGEAIKQPKALDAVVDELARITGQKAAVRRAKKSIAQFKVRQGMPIGAMVTLRGERMFEFLDRLMNVSLPRVRDFRGVSPKGFDGRGNFTLGLRDQLIFLEIDYLKVDKARGMNVSVATTAKTDEEARKLLQLLGMPFRQN
jgi:large subunit ribosomal protein L5